MRLRRCQTRTTDTAHAALRDVVARRRRACSPTISEVEAALPDLRASSFDAAEGNDGGA